MRGYTRCNRCGRPHSVYKKFGLCRICLREMAHAGELPGVTKSQLVVSPRRRGDAFAGSHELDLVAPSLRATNVVSTDAVDPRDQDHRAASEQH